MMDTERVLVVDGNSILNRAFYAIRTLTTRDGQPTNALFGFVNILNRELNARTPAYAAVAFDLHAPTFRHKMYEEYKAGRRPTPPELLAQFAPAKECCKALGFHVLELEGYEADDILGTVSAMARDEGKECYLLTGDRDALQLVDERVHVLLATNTETVDVTPAVFREKYGIDPIRLIDLKALMGDSSDHIPGVPGIGEKTALGLLTAYGTLEGVYEALPEARLTPSARAKLEAGRESAALSYRLAAICRTAPLGLTLADIATAGIDRPAALKLFRRLEFYSHIKHMGLEDAGEKAPENTAVSVTAAETVAVDFGALREKFTGDKERKEEPVALDLAGESWTFFDGKTLYTLSCVPDRDTFSAFLAERQNWICYDCKSLYHRAGEQGISFRSVAFDVMLAAYVVSAGEGSYEIDRLSLSYLHESLPAGASSLPAVYRLRHVLEEQLRQTEQERIFYGIEMPLATVLTDMEEAGFHVDRAAIAAYGRELDEAAAALESRIITYAGRPFNVNSPKQLGDVLFGEDGMCLPAPKKTKTGYPTSAEVLEKLRRYHPIIDDILDFRQLTKLKSTYCDGLLRVVGEDGQVHTTFKQTGTATGRLSSAEPNLQNIPVRTELGRELRRFFVPEKAGYLLLDADYSQIELRLLAAITEDENMCAAFREKLDIHTSTAATVFHVSPESVTPEMRKRAKAVNFGILYGMGEFSLAEDLHVSRATAKEYIEHYLASYPAIDAYLRGVKEKAREQGYVSTLFGRRRNIPELKSSNANLRHFGERVAMNSPIQGTAADIIKLAMINVHRRLKEEKLDARLILQVHDELLIETAPDCKERARAILQEEMEHAVTLPVPLDVSLSEGATWYDAK